MTIQSLRGSSLDWVPMASRIDLNLLMVFLEIVNAGSISQASVRLQMPKATLSRKLRQLEEQIGAVLLKRGPHTREMTEVGQSLFYHCERIAAEASIASGVASEMQSQLRGTMRISIPFGLGDTWVSQALASFALQYPDIKLTIHVSNRWVDVSEEAYDVVIFIGRVRNEHLPSRLLGRLARGIYASPTYIERKGVPHSRADLVHHDCVALESQLDDGLWTFPGADGGPATKLTPRMTVTDIIVAREMAIAGVGFAILTHALCEPHVKTGRLVRVLPEHPIVPISIVATFLERRHMPLRTRAFIDLLAHAINRDLPTT